METQKYIVSNETLEDAIITAITQTSQKATSEMEEKIKSVTGGISIPGLC